MEALPLIQFKVDFTDLLQSEASLSTLRPSSVTRDDHNNAWVTRIKL